MSTSRVTVSDNLTDRERRYGRKEKPYSGHLIILRFAEGRILLEPVLRLARCSVGCCTLVATSRTLPMARRDPTYAVGSVFRYGSLADGLEEPAIRVDLLLILQSLPARQLQQHSLPQHVQRIDDRQGSDSLRASHS